MVSSFEHFVLLFPRNRSLIDPWPFAKGVVPFFKNESTDADNSCISLGYLCFGRAFDDYQSVSNLRISLADHPDIRTGS
ncbi:MAG: hypothetical protein Ct9H300mP19_11400 [Dehalococcoidia bacterium]|nr:MAG: hypothetical protein Ct9H300mP19_11400 [Dehalococcoidia bacterium]